MFGYTDEFLYDEDQPLAERRAAALALDTSLLAAVLGSGLDRILDGAVIADVTAERCNSVAVKPRTSSKAPISKNHCGMDMTSSLRTSGQCSQRRRD